MSPRLKVGIRPQVCEIQRRKCCLRAVRASKPTAGGRRGRQRRERRRPPLPPVGAAAQRVRWEPAPSQQAQGRVLRCTNLDSVVALAVPILLVQLGRPVRRHRGGGFAWRRGSLAAAVRGWLLCREGGYLFESGWLAPWSLHGRRWRGSLRQRGPGAPGVWVGDQAAVGDGVGEDGLLEQSVEEQAATP